MIETYHLMLVFYRIGNNTNQLLQHKKIKGVQKLCNCVNIEDEECCYNEMKNITPDHFEFLSG